MKPSAFQGHSKIEAIALRQRERLCAGGRPIWATESSGEPPTRVREPGVELRVGCANRRPLCLVVLLLFLKVAIDFLPMPEVIGDGAVDLIEGSTGKDWAMLSGEWPSLKA